MFKGSRLLFIFLCTDHALNPEMEGVVCRIGRQLRMKIESISILNRNNEPIFFKNLSKEMNEIESQCQVFMSLDFIQERLSSQKLSDPFLGLYYYLDHINFYSYCSANLTKVVMVLNWTDKPPKDSLIKSILFSLYQSYLKITSNPFYVVGTELEEREKGVLMKEIDSINLINIQS